MKNVKLPEQILETYKTNYSLIKPADYLESK